MSGELSKLNVRFKILKTEQPSDLTADNAKNFRWKDLQDLGHSPVDFSSPQSGESKITSEGYAGPEYKNPFRTGIQTPVSDIKLGLCLDINPSPGAPANSFVWGCEPKERRYLNNDRNLIICGMGPSIEFFAKVRSFTDEELKGTVGVNSKRPWLSGLAAGRAESGVYIPEHFGALPGNLSATEQNNLLKSGTYTTNNIWNIQDLANNTTGTTTGKYVEGQGAYAPNSLFGRASLRQSEGGRVGFFASNSKARIFQVGDGGNSTADAKPIFLKGKWFITADWGNYRYLYGDVGVQAYLPELSGTGPGSDVSDFSYFKPAALNIGNGGSKYIDTGIGSLLDSQNVSPGFVLNLKFRAKQALDIFRGGYSGVDVFIGNRSAITNTIREDMTLGQDLPAISGEKVQWAKISLSANRPPIIMFPTLYTSGARYIRVGADTNNSLYNVMQIIAGKKAIKADASDAEINIKYELLGDVGHIDVSTGGEATPINAVIAPQREVSVGAGQVAESNKVQSCWCAIDGFADLTVTNCVGNFSFSPLCYMSWSPDALMFNHHKFNTYWSDFVENSLPLVVEDNDPPDEGTESTSESSGPSDIFAEQHYSFENKLISAHDSVNPMPQTGMSRYPDIIVDRRVAKDGKKSVIGFMNMTREAVIDGMGKSGVLWKNMSSPSKEDFQAYDLSSDFVKDHSANAIISRKVYNAPSYGTNLIEFANYQIPSVAIWSHLYANAILVTAWPKTDHRGWISQIRNTTSANIFETSNYSNLSTTLKSDKLVNYDTSDYVSNFSLSSTYVAPIIKRTLDLTIINPRRDIISGIFGRSDIIQGNKLWVEFNAEAPTKQGNSSNSASFNGVITRITEKAIGAGIEINMQFQDPFSYAMEQLIYPSSHRIDGWPFHIALEYLLLRTGLKTNASMTDGSAYGLNVDQLHEVLIGRYVVSDQKANSISYEPTRLINNLNKALGPLLLKGQYPVFYIDKNNIIQYDNMLSLSGGHKSTREIDTNTSWSRFVLGTVFPIIGSANIDDSNYIPYERSLFSLLVDNTQTYNQILFSSKDRYRNTPIVSQVNIGTTSKKSSIKNTQIYNFDNVITSQSELAKLSQSGVSRQQPEATPMQVNFSVLGMPLTDINDHGGCGYIENKHIPFTNDIVDRYWMMKETKISWDANRGNQVSTEVGYEVLRPAIMSMANPLVGK